jgi:thiol-disulfide isomerase/thioredoxin
MTATRKGQAILLAAILAASTAALASETPPTTRPAAAQPPTTTRPVPKKVLEQFDGLFKLSADPELTRLELYRRYFAQMREVLALGAETEKRFPDATNLWKVHEHMLEAAQWLAERSRNRDHARQMLELAKRIVASDAPPQSKLVPDFHVTMSKIVPAADNPKMAGVIAGEIRGFVKRYAKTPGEALAVQHATALALYGRQEALREKLLKELESKHADASGVREFLREMGRSADVGKPFKAKLHRLNGKTLKLPDDLKGKVVVVDFWSTRCGPCVQSMPRMKAIYEKYKSKGLEIVGISLDEQSDALRLRQFVRTEKLNWTQTWSGMGWDDPTVQKYGIGAIPSLWVIGRDGKVISDAARPRLEAIIQEAVKQPAPDA